MACACTRAVDHAKFKTTKIYSQGIWSIIRKFAPTKISRYMVYWKISRWDIVTHNNIDSKKTSDRFSSIALYYCDNDFIIRTFDFIACSDAVQVTCSKKHKTVASCKSSPLFPIHLRELDI